MFDPEMQKFGLKCHTNFMGNIRFDRFTWLNDPGCDKALSKIRYLQQH